MNSPCLDVNIHDGNVGVRESNWEQAPGRWISPGHIIGLV
jgi:hypothetical protein